MALIETSRTKASPVDSKVTGVHLDFKVLWMIAGVLTGWGVSIEVRLASSMPARVANLEAELQPVLIEYGVRQELARRGGGGAASTPVITTDGHLRPSKPEYEPLLEHERTKVANQFKQAK